MTLFTVFILSLFLTIALVPVFKRMAFRMHIVDIPDPRKVHLTPMPKTGGISLAIGAFVPMLMWASKDTFFSAVLLGSLIIVVFGVIDDIKPLKASQKLVPQIAAALVVIFMGGVKITCLGTLAPDGCLLPGFLSIPLTLFVILGVTNAINLSDGLDGLAGGISMMTFVIIAYLAFKCDNMQIAIMSIAVAGGIAGFLRYNTHPAILFMGDAGSQLLGFLSVVFVLVLTQSNTPYSKVMALPLIGFPILDTLTVMVGRILKKKSPFAPDKNHFHHRLMRLGFFHSEAVLIIYLIQACYISMALVFRFYSDWVQIVGYLMLSALITAVFTILRRINWVFRQDKTIDTRFKRWIKWVREQHLLIRIFFGGVKFGFPLLFAFQILIPVQLPSYMSVIALGLILTIAASFLIQPIRQQKGLVLRFVIYLITPLLIFMTENSPAPWGEQYNHAGEQHRIHDSGTVCRVDHEPDPADPGI